MNTDTLGRSLPWDQHADPDERREKPFVFSPADIDIFEFIDRHGPLPSHYLRLKQFDLRRSKGHTLNRFTDFCRGSKEQGPIFVAPPQQFAQFRAHARHKVYELTPYARGLIEPAAVPPTGSAWFIHQLMQSCVGASFELFASHHGFRFVPRSEFLLDKHSGSARTAKNPMAAPLREGKTLVPDDLFALAKGDAKRCYLVEVDRASESMGPRALPKEGATYFGKKLDHYDELLDENRVHAWLGVRAPRVLIVTTTATRAHQIEAHVKALRHANSFYITVVPEFGANWRVPDHVLTHLLEDPWLTVNGPKLITA